MALNSQKYMGDTMKRIDEIIELAKAQPKKRLVVAVAEDAYVLKAVNLARENLNIYVTLVGDERLIHEALKSLNIYCKHFDIIDEPDKATACMKAVKLVHDQKGDILMKGLVDTSILLKAVLDKTYGLVTKNRLSHVTLIEIPTYHKLFMLSDAAMNMYPDAHLKKEIIENGVQVLKKLGYILPKVGVLAAIEKENPKMPATTDAVILKDMNQTGLIKDCIVDGPFALDNAMNHEAAIHKGIKSEIAGDVDFLLMPQIDAGNIFYKSLMFLSNAKSASLVCGAKNPIVLTSRADKIETKYASIALAKLM